MNARSAKCKRGAEGAGESGVAFTSFESAKIEKPQGRAPGRAGCDPGGTGTFTSGRDPQTDRFGQG
jgi:hypothetical protein